MLRALKCCFLCRRLEECVVSSEAMCVFCDVWLVLETFRLHLSCSSLSVFCLCHMPSSSSHDAVVSASAPSSALGTKIF